MDVLMTRKDVSEMLGISTRTLARLMDNDGLPYFKVGGQYRFDRAAVERWLDAREMSGVN